MDSKRAWTVWGVGVFAYLIAVTQRTSFGVVGLEATARFSASASALSAFTVIQLLVYAGLQIPVGVLVDRFGPRVMIATGAALMTVGQIQLAAATSVPGGVVGRIFVGAGDAMTFISVIRLIPAWFPSRRVPLLTQLTGQLGQFGQLISIAPFALVLHAWGWSPAFLGLAGLGLVACVLSTAALRNAPETSGPAVELAGIKETAEDLARAWQQPGTRLGMWSHFATQFAGNVFVMTWGYPFLVSGQGLDPTEASVLLSLFVVVGIICGPLLGGWVGRHPMRRSTMVLAVTFAITAAWLSVILYPGPAPLWLLVVLVLILALGGPASMIGFDFARTFNPSRRIGTATGIVNVGGFIAALITMYVVGLILDLLKNSGFSGGNLYSLDSFRIALSFQFIVLAIGVGAVIGMRNQVRRRMALAGETVPPLRQALADNARRRAQYRSELRAGRLAGRDSAGRDTAGRDTAGRDTAGKHDGGPAGQD
ncbi:MFS transporter [Arthrobacter sp. A2-55]|uniref:MFS transporter n=1 Tax=Arthrobacter sp. A2-55 TaxID=2897337 RepID=UPI0021CDE761|nr:MFS transporter [Arthrobacter sp. A2-55]MCU6481375.1 MFS transporter [Arthrobacter sp. A2-55]